MGSRGRRTASTWSSAIRVAPLPRRRSTCTRSRMVSRRQLTRPPANFSDIHPVVSPDGRYLAFVRLNQLAVGGSVFVQKLEQLHVAGEPVQLTCGRYRDRVRLDAGQPQRHPRRGRGGARIVANRGRRRGARARVTEHQGSDRPSVARSGAGVVVYQNALIESNIWELPTPSSPNRQPSGDATYRAHRVDVRDTDMRFSPDGTRVAFGSRRSGHSNLWVSNRDGSQATRLTNFEAAGGWEAPAGVPTASGSRSTRYGRARAAGISISCPPTVGPVKPLTSDAFHNSRPVGAEAPHAPRMTRPPGPDEFACGMRCSRPAA